MGGGMKNPMIAAALSILVPGLGQIWAHHVRRGFILFIVFFRPECT